MGAFSFLSVFFSILVLFSSAFNIDTRFAVIKEIDNPEAFFGYSVDQHARSGDANPVFDQILVGAPLDTTTKLSPFKNTGALYHCPVDVNSGQASTEDCEEFTYPDTQGAVLDLDVDKEVASENKTDMWLGVTVRSAGAGEFIVACGHRYKVQEAGRSGNVYGVGICYFYNSDFTLEDKGYKSPCAGEALVKQGSNEISGEFGLCAAGMGLDAVDSSIVYGLPGTVTWAGSAAWELRRDWPKFPLYLRLDPNLVGQNYTDLYSYQGSSTLIATNLFNGRKKVAVVGSPREFDTGTVMIYNLTETPAEMVGNPKIIGPQFGSAFGSSLATIDIKNDDHPSLVVGAPYYRPEHSFSKSPIYGAIYIYYNHGSGILRKHVLITPGECSLTPTTQCSTAQFGYSITSLGDINGDGYQDLAVGAPGYGNGAVFIYGGTSTGMLTEEPTQVVMASDIESKFLKRPLSGFGISVSGGRDMDGQGYTDLVVGAYSSSHVVVLRSRPVVTINGRINVFTSSVDPEKTVCDSNPLVSRPCIDFEVCFIASFEKSSASLSGVKIDYTVTVDSGYELAVARRVVFDPSRTDISNSEKSSRVTLSLDNSEKCINETVYVRDLRDILKPIQMDLKYGLVNSSELQFEDINKYLILNSTAPPAPSVVVDYKKDCKTRNCETDMAVRAMFDNKNVTKDPLSDAKNEFVFNSDEVDILLLTFTLVVDEFRDPAYVPQVNISLPPELKRVGNISVSDPATSCRDSEAKSGFSTCTFGKKLNSGTQLNVTFKLNPSGLGPTYSQINLTASTSSDDVLEANDVATLRVKVVVVTDLELLGTATIGDRARYGGVERGVAGIESDDQIGPLVQHTYTMINNGSGKVSKVRVNIQWPYATASGRYLLYMIDNPSFNFEKTEKGLGQCGVKDGGDRHINEEGYRIIDQDSLAEVEASSRYKVIRNRRDTPKRPSAVKTLTDSDGTDYDVALLNCFDDTVQCFNIECEFVNFGPGDVVRITLNSRLWNTTLLREYGNSVDYIRIMSNGALYIDPAAKVSQKITNDKANITTEVEPNIPTAEKSEIPFWVYIIAAGGGLLILILIIIIFWKCGFFKRHRPMTYEVKVEKQSSSQYAQVPQNDPSEIKS